MENSMNVSHEFIDVKESKDDEKCVIMNNAAVICIGSTGTGKSSLIKLFCGNNVKVGHTVKSETQGSSLFKEANCDRYWLDSQGANDSQGVDDEKVLTDVLKTLYDNSITNIKVIWCISGDFDRAKQEFQTQAKFIKSLGNGVWNSCLIVQKKGAIEPKKIDGVLEAARNKGANINYGDHRLFGYTGIDYMTDQDKAQDDKLEMVFEFTRPNSQERVATLLKYGYLNNKQIVEHVNERLSNLSSLKITFTVKKCEKCGVKGDPRFVYAPCHSEIEKYHPKATVPYHKEDLKIFHLGEIVKYHDRRTEGYHTGKCIRKHQRSLRWIHPGGISTSVSTEKYHWGEWIPWPCWRVDDKNKVRGRWTCCDQRGTKDDTAKKGCCERVGTVSNTWTCCGWSSGSSGCTAEYICCGERKGRNGTCSEVFDKGCTEEWDCCGASKYNQGCKRRYKCCHRDEDEPGCKSKYACCDGDEDSAGCREEYSCCKASADNPGCKRKYECCDEDEGETEGCEERCKACHKIWGDGPGCIETTKNRK